MKFKQVIIVVLSVIVIQAAGASLTKDVPTIKGENVTMKNESVEKIEKSVSQQIIALVKEIKEIKKMNKENKRDIADLKTQNEILEHRLGGMEIEDDKSKEQIADLEAKDAQSQRKITELEAEINGEEDEWKQNFKKVNAKVVKLTANYNSDIPKMEKVLSKVNKGIHGINNSIKVLMRRTTPVDGGYSEWSSYSSCSVTCGHGVLTRRRSCDSPIPLHGGKDCSAIGQSKEWKVCSTGIKCPVKSLTRGKVATQSSYWSSEYKADKAVDGKLRTKSCTHTDICWWRVDMGKTAVVYKVRLFTPSFVAITNTTVTIGNSANVADNMAVCGMFNIENGAANKLAFDVTCEKALRGRYIQVNKNSHNAYMMAIDEFEAYGTFV